MSDTENPKRRGRPTTGKALTSAERMARIREKARAALRAEVPADLSDLPDSALLDYLRQAFQERLTWHMADAVRELFKRANASARYPVQPTFERIEPEADNPVTVTEKDAGAEAENLVTVTEKDADIPVTVTKKSSRHAYSTETKAMAVAMADRGESSRAIHAAILETCGRAPDISNLARLVRSWRETVKDGG
jgi:hypothetical protein